MGSIIRKVIPRIYILATLIFVEFIACIYAFIAVARMVKKTKADQVQKIKLREERRIKENSIMAKKFKSIKEKDDTYSSDGLTEEDNLLTGDRN